MNTHTFQKIERVFHAALKLEPGVRGEFVANQFPDEPALRGQVESLLTAAEQGAAFLETSLLAGSTSPPARPESLIGREIGPYRLIRELGHGGMGTVYEAEQRWPHRRVALKVVHTGPGGAAAWARWSAHEPRILGRLNHPSVASIYDADRTEDGLSYFVMELIEGEQLDTYAQKHGLPRRARLNLFCKICDAIQHAHMKSVVHLDLKPSNILVLPPKDPASQDLQVKVVDFGVAAITGTDTTRATGPGATGTVVGTLAYMSPEQRRGDRDAADVRSDVYSLGVILFKLMTGDLPYPVENVPIPEAWRIFAQPPRRPRAVDPGLSRDIETIIRTAMAEEPARRYQSVAELGGDIRLYLTDRPITARRPSKLYEWTKFAQRNKGLVGTLAAIVLGLITTTIGTYSGLLRAREAEEHARVEAEARRAVTAYMAGQASDQSGSKPDGRPSPSPPLLRSPLEVLRINAQQMFEQGRLDEAATEYAGLVKLAKDVFPEGNWYVAKLQGERGDCLVRLRRFEEAELPLLTSYDGLMVSYGNEHKVTIEAIERLIRLYDAWGKPEKAAEWRNLLLRATAAGGLAPE